MNVAVVERIVSRSVDRFEGLVDLVAILPVQIQIVIPDQVVPWDTNQPNDLVEWFKCFQIIKRKVAKRNTERVVATDQFSHDILRNVVDLGHVARLRIPKQNDPKGFWLGHRVHRKINGGR